MRSAIAAASTLGLALAAAPFAGAQETSEPRRLAITAVGEAVAAPDLATVSIGVQADGKTAAEAMAGQRDAMTAVMAALTASGVAERDIQTASLQLYPQRNYDRSSSGRNEITGYTAANQVSAVVRDLEKVGPTLDQLVEAGANDIQGVTFGVEAADELADAARRDAVETLTARAALYADAAGFTLGPLLELSESGGFTPVVAARARQMEAFDASTPVSGGELSVSITINGIYAIADK